MDRGGRSGHVGGVLAHREAVAVQRVRAASIRANPATPTTAIASTASTNAPTARKNFPPTRGRSRNRNRAEWTISASSADPATNLMTVEDCAPRGISRARWPARLVDHVRGGDAATGKSGGPPTGRSVPSAGNKAPPASVSAYEYRDRWSSLDGTDDQTRVDEFAEPVGQDRVADAGDGPRQHRNPTALSRSVASRTPVQR